MWRRRICSSDRAAELAEVDKEALEDVIRLPANAIRAAVPGVVALHPPPNQQPLGSCRRERAKGDRHRADDHHAAADKHEKRSGGSRRLPRGRLGAAPEVWHNGKAGGNHQGQHETAVIGGGSETVRGHGGRCD